MENLNTTGRLLAEINSLSPKEIREIFMAMWRDSPHLNDGLTADDCIEFFASALKGSSDFTFELLAQTCADYDVGAINNSFSLLPRQEYDRLKTAAIAAAPPERWLIPPNCCVKTTDLVRFISMDSVNDCEAKLGLRGLCSSHYLRYDCGRIYDIGCDGEDVFWLPEEFEQFYENAWWQIEGTTFHRP